MTSLPGATVACPAYHGDDTMKNLKTLIQDESGVGVVEYAILSAFGAAAVLGFYNQISQPIANAGADVATQLNTPPAFTPN